MITTRKKTDSPIVAQAMDIMDKAAEEVANAPYVFPEGTVMGETLMDEVVKEPTLDRYLDGNPKIIMPNYEEMVALLQKKRALFITSEQKKKEPKIEGEDDGEVV